MFKFTDGKKQRQQKRKPPRPKFGFLLNEHESGFLFNAFTNIKQIRRILDSSKSATPYLLLYYTMTKKSRTNKKESDSMLMRKEKSAVLGVTAENIEKKHKPVNTQQDNTMQSVCQYYCHEK